MKESRRKSNDQNITSLEFILYGINYTSSPKWKFSVRDQSCKVNAFCSDNLCID